MKELLYKYQQLLVGVLTVTITVTVLTIGVYNGLNNRINHLEERSALYQVTISELKDDMEYIRRVLEDERADLAGLDAKVDDLRELILIGGRRYNEN